MPSERMSLQVGPTRQGGRFPGRWLSVCGGIGGLLLLASCSAPASALPTVTIDSCYDGDTCRTTQGERVRLACIDSEELRGHNANPVPVKAARDFLRRAVVGRTVSIRRIETDRYGRTVAELSSGPVNYQELMASSCIASALQSPVLICVM